MDPYTVIIIYPLALIGFNEVQCSTSHAYCHLEVGTKLAGPYFAVNLHS